MQLRIARTEPCAARDGNTLHGDSRLDPVLFEPLQHEAEIDRVIEVMPGIINDLRKISPFNRENICRVMPNTETA